jgi:hypothetical protein
MPYREHQRASFIKGTIAMKHKYMPLLLVLVMLYVGVPLALADDGKPSSPAVQAAQDKLKADRIACHTADKAAGVALRTQMKAAHDKLAVDIKAGAAQASIDSAKAKIKADAAAARAQIKAAREACRAQLKKDRAALKAARLADTPGKP